MLCRENQRYDFLQSLSYYFTVHFTENVQLHRIQSILSPVHDSPFTVAPTVLQEWCSLWAAILAAFVEREG